MIKIQAAQASTGIILSEDYSWYTQKPEQSTFERTFQTEEEARAFCEAEFNERKDIEFLMTKDDGTSIRLVAPD